MILMNKRDETDIWANMYDLPLIETFAPLVSNKLRSFIQVTEYFGRDIKIIESLPVITHLLTHQRLHVQFIKIQSHSITLRETWFYTPVENLKNFAMPKIIFIFLKNIFNL
jgi:A/G-specific adenine glycosylase